MRITKYTRWRSIHGIVCMLKDLKNSHLINLTQWIKFYYPYDTELLEVLEELRQERSLPLELFERGQVPYKNPYGKWEIWDFDSGCPVELE